MRDEEIADSAETIDVTPGSGDFELKPGDNIGDYTIRSIIGEGGFGVVYIAEQVRPVRRNVALKVIKPGMDTRAVVARFEGERQALAMMDHPAIAKVFDAGSTDKGRPFFVMEHVKGEPISEFCDKHKFSIEQRLEMFIQICGAVQHAHSKGIIHRDLKPGNILVEYHDGTATPKIIDFGVAKALTHHLSSATVYTQQGQMIGTPEYMSPEQAEMSALDVDTRSDIYSLGVVLYELLTGELPFSSEALRGAGLVEVQRIIRDSEPPKPSTRLSTVMHADDDSGLASRMAQARGVALKELPKRLRGDLDWIVMRCLEKDRERRYQTANAVALEVSRHLRNEPVEAGPPSPIYRAKKFVRRNRAGVTAATLVGTALILGFIGTGVGWVRATAARQAEHAALAEAEARATELEELTEFQSEMLSGVDLGAMGTQIISSLRSDIRTRARESGAGEAEIRSVVTQFDTAIASVNATNAALDVLDGQILEKALQTSDEQFDDQPAMAASVRRTVGNVYRRLGILNKAERNLDLSLETRRRELGDEHPETLKSMHSLASLYEDQGRYDEAITLLLETLESRRRVLGSDDEETIASEALLGIVYQNQGRLDDAEPLFVRAYEYRLRELGEEHEDTLGSMNSLAILHLNRGELAESEQMFERMLDLYVRKYGEEDAKTFTAMNNIAVVYGRAGRNDEALELYRACAEIQRRAYGDEHPNTLLAQNNLAGTLNILGRYEEAQPLYRDTLRTRERVFGKDHPDTLTSMRGLGSNLTDLRRLDEAEVLLGDALEAHRRTLGESHRDTLSCMYNLAVCFAAQERFDEAEQMQRDLLALRRETFGDEHRDTLASLRWIGQNHVNRGRFEEAESLLLATLETHREALGETNRDTLNCLQILINCNFEQAKYDVAESMYQELHAARKDALGEDHRDTISSLINIGVTLQNQDKFAEAVSYYREGLALRERVLGESHADTVTVVINLTVCLVESGAVDEAAEMYPILNERSAQVEGTDGRFLVGPLQNLSITLYNMDREEESISLMERAFELEKSIYGFDHEETFETRRNLGIMYNAAGRVGDAETVNAELVTIAERDNLWSDANVRTALGSLVDIYTDQDRLDEARPLVDRQMQLLLAAAEAPDATDTDKNNCAWEYLTCAFEELRDPEIGLRIAREACEMTEFANAGHLDTFALAQHMTGDTAGALETQRTAVGLLTDDIAADDPLRVALEESLARYEAAMREGPVNATNGS